MPSRKPPWFESDNVRPTGLFQLRPYESPHTSYEYTPPLSFQGSCLSFLLICDVWTWSLGTYEWASSATAFINSRWLSAHLSLTLISQPINELIEKECILRKSRSYGTGQSLRWSRNSMYCTEPKNSVPQSLLGSLPAAYRRCRLSFCLHH